jgi:thiamine pyrophosphokinase
MIETRAVIFANGVLHDNENVRSLLQSEDVLIGADGGTHHILDLGLLPSIVIGDLDSLSENHLNILTEAGVRILQYPVDKDHTDLELVFDYVVNTGYQSILVLAAFGGRLDQTLSNLALLTRPDLLKLDVRMHDGNEEAFFIQREGLVRGMAGDSVSLLPWGNAVIGITTGGLRWPLIGETLYPHKTRGISNEMLGEQATIKFDSGLLLCIHQKHKPE